MRTILALAGYILISGCTDERILKPPLPDVQMTLMVTPSFAGPAHPDTITAEVVNNGATSLWRIDGCGYWYGMHLDVIDPDSNVVYLWNPVPEPMCPDGPVPFSPGQRLKGEVVFDGILYGPSGNQEAAKSGAYRVIVKFVSRRYRETQIENVIEKRTAFQWN